MRPSRLVALVFAVFGAMAVAAQTPEAPGGRGQPPQAGTPRIPDSVAQQAMGRGRVRVIVGLSGAFMPESRLDLPAQARQRADIAAAQTAVLADLAGVDLGQVKRFHLVPGMALEADFATLQFLAADPRVAYIEEDALAFPTLGQSEAIIGANTVWASGYVGSGQTVAILDTGVDRTHVFLGGRVVSEACYSTTSTGVSTSLCAHGTTGTDAAAPCSGLCDHGTHVAGIAAGNGTGSVTINGVARGANIIAIQVFSQFVPSECGSSSPCVASYSSDQVLGLQRVYDLRNTYNIAAINMSLGGGQYTSQASCDAANTTRKNVIDQLRAAGIATVIASGNNGYSTGISAPGCISSAVSVGSTDDGSSGTTVDAISSFSNSASFLTLLAPGRWITSSVPGGTFQTWSGTSMATPHVAGAFALLKSRYTGATVAQVLNALTSTGTSIVDPRNGIAKPRINLDLAMSALAANCTYSLSASSASVSSAGGALTVGVTTQPGCAWTAVSNSSFLQVGSGSGSGIGSGSVIYMVSINSSTFSRTGTLTIAGSTFTVSQQGQPMLTDVDINDDGMADLVLHNSISGRVGAWLMNGRTLIDGVPFTPVEVTDLAWKIVGGGDFNGDGEFDIVWQHDDGWLALWLMSGRQHVGNAMYLYPNNTPDRDWRVVSVRDIDGDGKPDLVLRHRTDGLIAAWLMNGATRISGQWFSDSRVDTAWTIVGSGDFNGDGRADLVWQHTDGSLAVWFMNGTTKTGVSLLNPAQLPSGWTVTAVTDLNLDRKGDLILQHTDGRLAVWYFNGTTIIDGAPIVAPLLTDGWHVVAPR